MPIVQLGSINGAPGAEHIVAAPLGHDKQRAVNLLNDIGVLKRGRDRKIVWVLAPVGKLGKSSRHEVAVSIPHRGTEMLVGLSEFCPDVLGLNQEQGLPINYMGVNHELLGVNFVKVDFHVYLS